MVMGEYLVSLLASDEVDDIVCAEVLLDVNDSLQGDHQQILTLDLRLGMQTVITVAAVILRISLSEIMQEHLPPADGRLSVGCGLYQELSPDILFCHRLSFHKLIQFLQVLI